MEDTVCVNELRPSLKNIETIFFAHFIGQLNSLHVEIKKKLYRHEC